MENAQMKSWQVSLSYLLKVSFKKCVYWCSAKRIHKSILSQEWTFLLDSDPFP